MMSDTTDHEWVLPASIPFEDLKGHDLEECVYWLLDAMGAKDLEWRTGGSGGGAADGGRDLEAHFFEPDDEGELKQQTWWVECKGRTGTVEPNEVKSAVNNALAYEGLDRLVIATNTQFSNPTRDWVKQWQKKHPSPKIQLWDRAHLERYLSRHPDVVLRLFSEALSIHGRIQAMESRFWNKLEFVPDRTLADLWKEKGRVEITPLGVFALIANEFANGNISGRPWGAALGQDLVAEGLNIGLINAGYLLLRSSRAGIDQRILYRTFAYLILVVLSFLSASATARLVLDSLNRSDTDPLPDEIQELLLMPIVGELLSEMRDVCSNDCTRVSPLGRSTLTDKSDEVGTYWLRLDPKGREESIDNRILIIERHDAPCVVGFPVNKEHGCPLFAFEPAINNVEEFMDIVKRVAFVRKKQDEAKREQERREDEKRKMAASRGKK